MMMQRKMVTAVILAGLALGLSGCGYTPGQRALSGGAIGAGAGAIVGAAAAGNPAMGALIGGGVGALGGALTSPSQINLGRGL